MGGSHPKQYNHSCKTFEWKTEHTSGWPVKSSRQARMDVVKTTVPVSRLSVGATLSRQNRVPGIYTAANIQLKIFRSQRNEGGRSGTDRLGFREQFCQPSYKTTEQGDRNSSATKSSRNSHCAMVASTDLVQQSGEIVNLPANQSVQESNYTSESSSTGATAEPQVENFCLENLWEQGALQQGWSIQAASRLKFGWAQSTISNYNVYIGKAKLICDKLEVDFPPTTTSILAECIMRISSDSDRPLSMINCLLASLTHVYTALCRKNTLLMICLLKN